MDKLKVKFEQVSFRRSVSVILQSKILPKHSQCVLLLSFLLYLGFAFFRKIWKRGKTGLIRDDLFVRGNVLKIAVMHYFS